MWETHLDHIKNNSRLTVQRADVSNYGEIQPFFKEVDWVFHLAALADIVPSIQEPLAYHKANVDGTIAVLEAARSASVKRFIYAASSSCYGIPDEFPTPETAPIRPMYPYALTKYLGEQYVLHWNKVYKLSCVPSPTTVNGLPASFCARNTPKTAPYAPDARARGP